MTKEKLQLLKLHRIELIIEHYEALANFNMAEAFMLIQMVDTFSKDIMSNFDKDEIEYSMR